MELIVILVIALLVLGPKRLPDAGRSVGKGLREFKDAISGKDDDEPAIAMPTTPAVQPAPAPAPVAAAPVEQSRPAAS
ncbi:MAG: twin-arginine translocase TatA/TatE family subunit [Patulibacter minatonensis]